MSDKLWAKPDQLRQAASIANAKADEVDSLVDTTNQRIDTMMMTFDGRAAAAVDPLQLQFTTDMRAMTNRLREHARSLMDSANTQDTSDSASQTVLNSVHTPVLNLT